MNVLYLGKYPPIQGGTSSAAFWRIQEFEQYNIQTKIVTCISSKSEYIIPAFNTGKNVHIISSRTPWHIPYSQLYSERMISEALLISEKTDIDIVEGCYLYPYGFAATIVSKILNKPLILRHAGSDLYRLISDRNLLKMTKIIALTASVIFTHKNSFNKWVDIGIPQNKLSIIKQYYPSPRFLTNTKKNNEAVFMGKITPKWDKNQLEYFHKVLCQHNFNGQIHIYSDNATFDIIYNFFSKHNMKIRKFDYVTPAYVPDILGKCKYLLVSSAPKGIPVISNLYMEGLAAGCCVVSKNTFSVDDYQSDVFTDYIKEQVNIYNTLL